MKLRIKRDALSSLIEAQRDALPREQYTHLLRFAQTKKASDLTPWDLFEVSTWLKCMPSDFVTLD
tara:strand:- start:588 stop:782 length:195 start_codon:yes stop_codon:yes gene_type:complete